MKSLEEYLELAGQHHGHMCPGQVLGVRMAMRNAYGLADLPKPAEMMERARPWRPYASVASWYLWRSLDGPGAL